MRLAHPPQAILLAGLDGEVPGVGVVGLDAEAGRADAAAGAGGMTLEDVKNQLGHSTIVLTSNTCGHLLEQRQQEMARGMDAVLAG
jgi:hypothetical protein